MNDYIKREDAIEAAINAAYDAECGISDLSEEHIRSEMEKLHAADVVEVVRCKDCKYWNQECCARFGWLNGKSTEEDWYCPNGERRTNNG